VRRKRGVVGADDGRGRGTPGRRRARGDVDRAPACRRIDSFRTGVKTPLAATDDASAAAECLLLFLISVIIIIIIIISMDRMFSKLLLFKHLSCIVDSPRRA